MVAYQPVVLTPSIHSTQVTKAWVSDACIRTSFKLIVRFWTALMPFRIMSHPAITCTAQSLGNVELKNIVQGNKLV